MIRSLQNCYYNTPLVHWTHAIVCRTQAHWHESLHKVPNYTACWTEAHLCEQLAQGTMQRPRVEPVTSRSRVRHLTTTPPSHQGTLLSQAGSRERPEAVFEGHLHGSGHLYGSTHSYTHHFDGHFLGPELVGFSLNTQLSFKYSHGTGKNFSYFFEVGRWGLLSWYWRL